MSGRDAEESRGVGDPGGSCPRCAVVVDDGGAAGDLLAQLVGGPVDPFALAAARLEERALLWDAEAVARRAVALAARHAVFEGRRRLDRTWFAAVVDEAIDALALGEGRDEADLADLAVPLGVSARAGARALRALNRRPLLERRAFAALLLRGDELDGAAHGLGRDAGSVARAARSALVVLAEEFCAERARPSPSRAVLDPSLTRPDPT